MVEDNETKTRTGMRKRPEPEKRLSREDAVSAINAAAGREIYNDLGLRRDSGKRGCPRPGDDGLYAESECREFGASLKE